jgi:hypothetical protein
MTQQRIPQKDDALRVASRFSDRDPIVLLDFADSSTVPPRLAFYLNLESQGPIGPYGYTTVPIGSSLMSEGKLWTVFLLGLCEATAKLNAVAFVVPFTRRETVAFASVEKEPLERYWGAATNKYAPEEPVYIFDAYLEAQCYQYHQNHLTYGATTGKFGMGFLSALGLRRPVAIPLPSVTEFPGTGVAVFASNDVASPDIRDFVSSLRKYRDQRRRMVREIVAREIRSSRSPQQSLDHALDTIFTFPASERLDEAIDLLVETEELTDQLAREALASHSYDRHRTDEYWYCLVRSLGKLGKEALVSQFAQNSNRSIREAVVEALGEINDKLSITLLQQLATNDESEFIRELARNTLAEHPE